MSGRDLHKSSAVAVGLHVEWQGTRMNQKGGGDDSTIFNHTFLAASAVVAWSMSSCQVASLCLVGYN